MARPRSTPRSGTEPLGRRISDVDVADSSLLDLVDNVLNNGVVLHGELLLGVANVDLIYLRISVLLAAVDRLLDRPAPASTAARGPRRRR